MTQNYKSFIFRNFFGKQYNYNRFRMSKKYKKSKKLRKVQVINININLTNKFINRANDTVLTQK